MTKEQSETADSTETFDFGWGQVPAKRHKNPDGSIGGWVAATAFVALTAFLSPTAVVYGNARVSDNARVYGDAVVSGDARVSGNARVSVTPITISGAEYPVTIVDAPLVCVGCRVATLEQWENGHAPEQCPKLEAMRPALIAIAKTHHAQFAKPAEPQGEVTP